MATLGAGVEHAARVGVGLAGGEVGGGEKGGDGVAVGERVDVGVGEVGAVVDRRRAELDGELDARAGAELVAVDAQAEPGGAAGLEHGARLVGVERALLAEDVDPARERRARSEHVAGDERDVVVGVGARGDDMGAEERDVVGEPGGDLAAPAFGLDVEPVAGLDLEVGDTGPQRLLPPDRGQRRELLGGRGTGGVGRDADAARGVRRAGHPRGELVAAVAGEHEVRMRVHEPRDHAAALGVDALVGGSARALDGGDDAVLDHQRGVAHEAEGTVSERLVVRDEQPDVVDDDAHASASRSAAGTSKPVCCPSRTIQAPPTITERTSAAVAA